MIYLFGDEQKKSDPLTRGALWYATKHESLTPINDDIYKVAEFPAKCHGLISIESGKTKLEDLPTKLNANEAAIIVAHGEPSTIDFLDYQYRNVTESLYTLVKLLLETRAEHDVPLTIFIAACYGTSFPKQDPANKQGSKLKTLIYKVIAKQRPDYGSYCKNVTVGGFNCTVDIYEYNDDNINEKKRGWHIFGQSKYQNDWWFHGYDTALVGAYKFEQKSPAAVCVEEGAIEPEWKVEWKKAEQAIKESKLNELELKNEENQEKKAVDLMRLTKE